MQGETRNTAGWCAGAFVALLMVWTGVATAAQPAQADANYREAERLYREAGDVTGAMSRLRGPADAGHAPSQALLGEILDRAEFNDEAVAYFRKAAAQGDPAGEYGLGVMYAAGEGVKKDLAQSLDLLTRSAEKGYNPAVKVLAAAYLKDDKMAFGKAVDPQVAQRWVREAAKDEYLPAVEGLARAYRDGGLGLEKSAQQAKQWTERAAEIRKKQKAAARGRNTRG